MISPKPSLPPASIFNEMYAKLQANSPQSLELNDDDLDGNTPPDVIVTSEAREPQFDPTLGIAVDPGDTTPTANRLVAIGDSLTHGFQSGAILNTNISYPAIIAYEMGWNGFRYPTYRGFGGLPLNIEYVIRYLEDKFGPTIDWWEVAFALFSVRNLMGEIEDWWERGAGSHVPQNIDTNHNLAVYGWDVRDVLSRTGDYCFGEIGEPKNQLFRQIVENANERAALRTLNYINNAQAGSRNTKTVLEQAADLAASDQIETLIVFVGANNALGSVLHLDIVWSEDAGYQDLKAKNAYRVWRPVHFETEFDLLTEQIETIRAKHVIFATVPHVTIAPVARGIGSKIRNDSRYFPNYTRPWIADADFDARSDPNITGAQARAIDSAIDQYNYCIENTVRTGRSEGKDWYLLDTAGLLDRLACRRYIENPAARPSWWTKYELPPEFNILEKLPDSKFFSATTDGKLEAGGLFSLDGVHPTTISYGILAQEFINVMQRANVPFFMRDGQTARTGPVRVDFSRLIQLDTLISDPPRSVGSDLRSVGWVNQKIDVFKRMLATS